MLGQRVRNSSQLKSSSWFKSKCNLDWDWLVFFFRGSAPRKYLRRNPQHDTGGGGSRRSSIGSHPLLGPHPHPNRLVGGHYVGHASGVSVENGERGPTVTALIPHKSLASRSDRGGGGWLKDWVPSACDTATAGTTARNHKHGGWHRGGFENEAYAPRRSSNGV